MSPVKLLSVIIVSFNTRDILLECIRHLEKAVAQIDTEVFVVDNASSDGSATAVAQECKGVKLISSPVNLGFAAANNLAITKARGRYLLLLNPDVFVQPGTLSETLEFMHRNPLSGILGVRLVGANGAPQRSARRFPNPWLKFLVLSGLDERFRGSKIFGAPDYGWWDHSKPRPVDWVTGAYFLLRREIVEEIGLMDERFFMYCEEMDYCLRAARAGWRVVIYPQAVVTHLGGASSPASSGGAMSRQLLHWRIQSEYRFLRKHRGFMGVLQAAMVEAAMKTLSIAKNSITGGSASRKRRREAADTLDIMLKALVSDGFGRGVRSKGGKSHSGR